MKVSLCLMLGLCLLRLKEPSRVRVKKTIVLHGGALGLRPFGFKEPSKVRAWYQLNNRRLQAFAKLLVLHE